jgi:hypothetical protein
MQANLNNFKLYLIEVLGRYQFLTYNDIAKVFSIARQTLYNDRSAGLLKPINGNSKAPRFSLEEIFAYCIVKKIISIN